MKKVALVGYTPSWRQAPYDDKDIEIWVMNDLYELVPRYDRVFDIHDINEIKTRKTRHEGKSQYEVLKTLKKPVYMQAQYADIPTSIRFPLDELIENYYIPAMGDKIFLTCSVAHMLALAIYEGYEEIQFYGIHEAVDSEYKDEMPSVLYWLGVAYGRGIKISISQDSPLLKGWFIYGFEEQKKSHFDKFCKDEMDRISGIKDQAIAKQQAYHDEEMKCAGASAILQHLMKITGDFLS